MVHIHKHASPWLQQRLQDTMYGLSMGKNLGVALDLAGHKFPDEESIAYITTIASREDSPMRCLSLLPTRQRTPRAAA